jgi:hypothetical protein
VLLQECRVTAEKAEAARQMADDAAAFMERAAKQAARSVVRLAQEDPKTFVPLLIKTMPPEPRVPQENGLNIRIDLT